MENAPHLTFNFFIFFGEAGFLCENVGKWAKIETCHKTCRHGKTVVILQP